MRPIVDERIASGTHGQDRSLLKVTTAPLVARPPTPEIAPSDDESQEELHWYPKTWDALQKQCKQRVELKDEDENDITGKKKDLSCRFHRHSFVVDQHGDSITLGESLTICATIRRALFDIDSKTAGLKPQFGKCSLDVREQIAAYAELRHPLLRKCHDHWKTYRICRDIYPNWWSTNSKDLTSGAAITRQMAEHAEAHQQLEAVTKVKRKKSSSERTKSKKSRIDSHCTPLAAVCSQATAPNPSLPALASSQLPPSPTLSYVDPSPGTNISSPESLAGLISFDDASSQWPLGGGDSPGVPMSSALLQPAHTQTLPNTSRMSMSSLLNDDSDESQVMDHGLLGMLMTPHDDDGIDQWPRQQSPSFSPPLSPRLPPPPSHSPLPDRHASAFSSTSSEFRSSMPSTNGSTGSSDSPSVAPARAAPTLPRSYSHTTPSLPTFATPGFRAPADASMKTARSLLARTATAPIYPFPTPSAKGAHSRTSESQPSSFPPASPCSNLPPAAQIPLESVSLLSSKKNTHSRNGGSRWAPQARMAINGK